uniref:Un-named hu7910 n=1 Tax=Gadus morhua TaxID=8049 RepID=A0A8C5B562_GADMO
LKSDGGTTMFTWFVVLALLGVWSSVAVVYFDVVDYDSVIARAKEFRVNFSEVLQGKLMAYDRDGDGDFDMEDAKVRAVLEEEEEASELALALKMKRLEAAHKAHHILREEERRRAEEEENIRRMAEKRREEVRKKEAEEDKRREEAQRVAEEKRKEEERKKEAQRVAEEKRREEECKKEAQRLAEEKRKEEERKKEAQRVAEEKRKEEESKKEAQRVAEEKRKEEERKKEAQRVAEEKRKEEERKKEAQRVAEEKRKEQERKKEAQRVAEEKRKEEECKKEAQRVAEEKRKEEERKKEAQRVAEEKRKEEERKKEAQRVAEEKRKEEERKKEAQRLAEEKRKEEEHKKKEEEIRKEEERKKEAERLAEKRKEEERQREGKLAEEKRREEERKKEAKRLAEEEREEDKRRIVAERLEKERIEKEERERTARVKNEREKLKSKPKLLNKLDKTIKVEIDAAEKLRKKGKVEEALKSFEALVQRFPQSPRARYGKAQAEDDVAEKQRSNDLLQRAINSYREASELPSATPDLIRVTLKRRAERQQFLGRNRGALLTLERLVEVFPEDLGLKNDLGVAHLLIGDNKGAKRVYEEVLAVAPGDGFALVHYGFILKSENQIAESIPYLKGGLESGAPGTDDGRFYFHLGDALQRVGDDSAYHWYELGHQRGHFASVWQRSLYNVDGLQAQPWWTPQETGYTDLVKALERGWKAIREEVLAVLDLKTGLFMPEEENLRERGEWGQYTLWQQGRKAGDACRSVPKTCSLLERFPEATNCKRGQIKFSVMQPGTHVWPHTGPTNCRLRMHLGLVVPEKGCRIRCTNQTRYRVPLSSTLISSSLILSHLLISLHLLSPELPLSHLLSPHLLYRCQLPPDPHRGRVAPGPQRPSAPDPVPHLDRVRRPEPFPHLRHLVLLPPGKTDRQTTLCQVWQI